MAKIKNNFKYLMAFVASIFGASEVSAQDSSEPKSTGSEASAASAASGSLSAGAIAAPQRLLRHQTHRGWTEQLLSISYFGFSPVFPIQLYSSFHSNHC